MSEEEAKSGDNKRKSCYEITITIFKYKKIIKIISIIIIIQKGTHLKLENKTRNAEPETENLKLFMSRRPIERPTPPMRRLDIGN